MKYNFKIGDVVKLNPEEYNKSYGEMPNWNISDSYIIVKFYNETDSNGLPIVILNKPFIRYQKSDTITTHFLLPDIKNQRILKLKKINETI